jgi:2-aminomuconate deaminase
MTDGESIRTAGAPAPVGAYPHARRAGPLLFLSGIGPRSPDGPDILGVTLDADGKILAYDIEAQCHAVFRNVKAVLESAGAVPSSAGPPTRYACICAKWEPLSC